MKRYKEMEFNAEIYSGGTDIWRNSGLTTS